MMGDWFIFVEIRLYSMIYGAERMEPLVVYEKTHP
jgi:hypothetical protein